MIKKILSKSIFFVYTKKIFKLSYLKKKMAEKNYAIFSIIFTIISMILLLIGAIWLTVLFMSSSSISWVPVLLIIFSIIFFIIGMIIMMFFYTSTNEVSNNNNEEEEEMGIELEQY